MEEEDVYEVERIEKERKRSGKKQYYVKWKGYPASENSWEPEKSILDKELIADFKRRTGAGKAAAPRKKVHTGAAAPKPAAAPGPAAAPKPAAKRKAPAAPQPRRQQPRRNAACAATERAVRQQEAEEASDAEESGSDMGE